MDLDLLTDFVRAYPAQPATAYWRAIEIEALLRYPLADGTGLDLGCGDGKLTRIILDRTGARNLIGLDADPKETAAASRIGLYRATCTGDATILPCPNRSLDFVISNSVLEHIPDLERVVAEIGRTLRSGGTMLITVPTAGFRSNLKGSVFPWVDKAAYLDRLDARLAHFHYLSSRDWAALLERSGLTLVDCFGYLDKRECRRWQLLSRFTGGLLHSISMRRYRPISIQRGLGLRALQSRFALPRWLARLVARSLAAGTGDRRDYWRSANGLDDGEAGCLVIVAARQ